MEFDWFDTSAPMPTCPEGSIVVNAEGRSAEQDPKTAFLEAARNLGRDLASNGAAPPFIRHLTIAVPDPAALRQDVIDYDLLYREALGGTFGKVALMKSDQGTVLQAAAIVPPKDDAAKFRGMDSATLNFQYSPRATVPEAPEIMASWRIDGAAFQKTRTAELTYGPDAKHRIDLYMPDGVSKPPLHVFIHGGYWQAVDKRDNGQFCRELVKAGLAVATLNYPLCPPATIRAIVADCQDAIALLYRDASKYGYDADHITVSGHSAGGHLTAMMAATDWTHLSSDLPSDLIKGSIPISGLFELEPLRHTGLNAALRLTEEEAEDLSPVFHDIRSPGPIVAAVGGAESDEFKRQSHEYVHAFGARGAHIRYLELPNLNHFTVVAALADVNSDLYKSVVEIAKKP